MEKKYSGFDQESGVRKITDIGFLSVVGCGYLINPNYQLNNGCNPCLTEASPICSILVTVI